MRRVLSIVACADETSGAFFFLSPRLLLHLFILHSWTTPSHILISSGDPSLLAAPGDPLALNARTHLPRVRHRGSNPPFPCVVFCGKSNRNRPPGKRQGQNKKLDPHILHNRVGSRQRLDIRSDTTEAENIFACLRTAPPIPAVSAPVPIDHVLPTGYLLQLAFCWLHAHVRRALDPIHREPGIPHTASSIQYTYSLTPAV